MFKNILATIGLLVVVKKGYELYCEYADMKQENEFWRAQHGEKTTDRGQLILVVFIRLYSVFPKLAEVSNLYAYVNVRR